MRLIDPTGPRLTRFDWLAVTFTVGLLLTLAFVTHARRPGALPEGGALHELRPVKKIAAAPVVAAPEQRFITVWVEGAVAHPRFYTLPKGAKMGDLLRQVELSDDAVTYKLKKRDVLVDHQTIVIPHRIRSKRLT